MGIVADHVPVTSGDWLRSHGITVLVVFAAAVVILLLSRRAVNRMRRRLEGAPSVTQALNLQRATTLAQAVSSVVTFMVWTLTVLLVLGQFAINLGPLIAGAGIAGVALGFGAQSLVRDFLSGFFILLEDQFGVSDVVEVNASGQTVTGKVESLSMRTTVIRVFDGTRFVVPNGNIQVVGNKSRGWARAIVDVGVAYGENLDQVREILAELFDELVRDADLGPAFLNPPEVLGVERLGDFEVVLRIVAEVKPSRRFDLERELRQRIKARFDERGIEIPFPHQVLISQQKDGEPEPPPKT
ncbi:MAG: mechanosensitive ion channel family protein [Actinomycetota bacterium]|nr:mechanosensitive ion channel family protein [Actinomycetota bacterium]